MLAIVFGFNSYKKIDRVRSMDINDINLGNVRDGIYTGSYDAGLVSARVRVAVKNHRITRIEIMEHNNGRGEPAENIVKKILKKQSLKVDAISGATISSKVICKAIEIGLEKGQ